mmetsp:Transcript_4967/g.11656  ORF Transcript_4967/g.11656 Transcript_4967/m.11656 type:complete len:727 (+) Transcript_4967:74-2254(+)
MAAVHGAAVLLVALTVALLPTATVAALLVRSSVTPLQKVITLLQDIKKEIETDGAAEATSYDQFACFCKSKTAALTKSIVGGQENIDSASATLEETTALKAEQEEQTAERNQKQEKLSQELSETKVRCTAEMAVYEAKVADLNKAIAAINDATQAIKDSMVVEPGVTRGTGLVSVQQSVRKSLAVAEAMKLISAGPRWGSVSAFLQSAVDPQDPDYKYHVQPVLDILAQLKAMLMKEKDEATSEFDKLKLSCSDTERDLTSQMSLNTATISQLQTAIGTSTSKIASTRGSLVELQDLLKDDQLYLKDLTTLCEQRAKDWDQRSQLRGNELQTLAVTLQILTGKVAETEVVNERALLQAQRQGGKAAQPAQVLQRESSLSFFQNGLGNHKAARGAGSESVSSQEQQQRLNKALTLLRQEGSHLGSPTLTALATRVSSDPFLKVKTLIQKLIERLLAEATDEATKKGFCDTELGKALQDRSFRFEETLKLNAELRVLEAKKNELELEIEDLTSSIEEMKVALAEATTERAAEKEDNLKTIQTAKDGLAAVTKAILILKAFYKDAVKAEVLMQEKASPVDEDTTGPGFKGAYRGKQQASKGIIGLLEVIKSDFSRTIHDTTKAEESAHAEFVELDQALRSDIKGKSTKKDLDVEDLATTDTTIGSKMEEMETNMALTDEALKKVEALKPMCIDTGMSFKERVTKRWEEVQALKRALCILGETDPTFCSE